MPEMQTTKLNKSPGSSMFKAMQMALKPSEKLLEKQKVLLTHLTRNSYKTAEEKLESRKAEKLKNEEEKKQTGFLAQLLGQSDKKGKSGGIWGFLKDNWGKIAIGIGLLLTPIKHLVAGFNWMKEYWENNTLAEMGADLATAFVVAMGLKIGAGVLFKKLSEVILKSLLPEGVELTAGALGRALLPAGSILAFVAGIGKSIWDGVEGWNFAKEWGVEGIDGAIGSFIGGTGKGLTGALTNALTKGGIGMGIGMMVGGPVGAIVGGVIGAAFGAITGWFGGERIAKWVNESRKEISKAWDNTTSILNDVMDKFKNWGNGIADDIISLVRKIPGFKDFGQTSEEKRRAAVGGDMTQLSTEEQNALQKNKHQQQDKALRGGAASAVAKGDITGIEKEIEAVGIEYSNLMSRGKDQPGFAQEKSRLGKRMEKLRQDKIAILDAQNNKKATKIGGTSKSALQQLKEDEGFRSKVYDDTEGIKTIGYGFNLERAGTQEALDAAGIKKSVADLKSGKVNLTEQEAERLMMGEYPYFREAAKRYLGEDKWPPFPEPKKDALTNMAYNLGEKKLNTFTNLREALRNEDYELAGQEVLRSKYATQVGARAQRISGALSAIVSPMEKSNAFNAQQNMNNELKMNQAGGNTIMIDKSTKQVNNSNSGSPMIKGLETDVVGKDITGKTTH